MLKQIKASDISISTMSQVLKSICPSGSTYSITQQNLFDKLVGLPLYVKRNRPDLISDVLISDLITLTILILIQTSFKYDINDTLNFDLLKSDNLTNTNFETITGYNTNNKTITYSDFKTYAMSLLQSNEKVSILKSDRQILTKEMENNFQPNEFLTFNYLESMCVTFLSRGPVERRPTVDKIQTYMNDLVANFCTSTLTQSPITTESYEYIGIM
jgi:hypothetical protein